MVMRARTGNVCLGVVRVDGHLIVEVERERGRLHPALHLAEAGRRGLRVEALLRGLVQLRFRAEADVVREREHVAFLPVGGALREAIARGQEVVPHQIDAEDPVVVLDGEAVRDLRAERLEELGHLRPMRVDPFLRKIEFAERRAEVVHAVFRERLADGGAVRRAWARRVIRGEGFAHRLRGDRRECQQDNEKKSFFHGLV
jgi:hypothetical protein